MNLFIKTLPNILFSMLLVSCVNPEDFRKIHKPDYDHLIGLKFEVALPRLSRMGFKSVREIGEIEELENRRSDGCIMVFGVRKVDNIIQYWRDDSKDTECLYVKKSFRS
jgi:hypothetical protein